MVKVPRFILSVVFLLWAALCVPGASPAQERVDPADATLEVILDTPSAERLEGEMILLTVRGSYSSRLTITLEKFEQPDLAGLNWVQLSRDKWTRTLVGGRQMNVFERRLAVFPQRAGLIEIGRFRHLLTLATSTGGRFQHEVRSIPIPLAVIAKPETGGWWLPAREVRISDEWDRPPDQLGPHDVARRTVTLEAVGVPAPLLPPIPAMRSSGVIVFVDPEDRAVDLTPDGPVSRVTWRWTVRPLSSAPASLEAVTIPWFDTGARQAREIVLPPQRIAFAAAAVAGAGSPSIAERVGFLAAPIGLVAGFLGGLALLLAGRKPMGRRDLLVVFRQIMPDPDLRALQRAARREDAAALRIAARRLINRTVGRDPRAAADLIVSLAELDRFLFARDAGHARFDFTAFRRSVVTTFGRSGRSVPGRA